VIVVLREHYDDPYDLRSEVDFVEAPSHARPLECLDLGLAEARGEIVHFLFESVRPTPDWTDVAMEHFADESVGAVACSITAGAKETLGVGYRPGGRRMLLAAHLTSRIVGPELRASFYRKSALEAIGGIPHAAGSEMADVRIGLLLRSVGLEVAAAEESVVECLDLECDSVGEIRRAVLSERSFWLNARLVGRFRAIASHPTEVLGELLTSRTPGVFVRRLIGRLLGMGDGLTASLLGDMKMRPVRRITKKRGSAIRRIDAPHRAGSRTEAPAPAREEAA